MPTLLHLDSSADRETSTSRVLTGVFADTWRSRSPDHSVIHRDLHADPLPHLESDELHWDPTMRRGRAIPEGAEALQLGILDEVFAADVLLIGLPLYNYSIPSTLAAWIDRVHVYGVTAGPITPLAGKPVIVATTSGGAYDIGTESETWDHATGALRVVFAESMGMDLTVVESRLTLSTRLGGPGERAAEEFAAAKGELERLALSVF